MCFIWLFGFVQESFAGARLSESALDGIQQARARRNIWFEKHTSQERGVCFFGTLLIKSMISGNGVLRCMRTTDSRSTAHRYPSI
ncbi:hypothetical protein F4803DRAFT_522661 [Xylaria telfairii]|nr:hypothetical protein F4803DRAFT_522661 [Xylaria telfairii]